QRDLLQGETFDSLLAYWRTQLAGCPDLLQLPTDRPRPTIQSFRGSSLPYAADPSLTAALRAFSRRENVTLFITLLTAFEALLHPYPGQDDICVGAPTANRMRVETGGLIGRSANTLVMRRDVGGPPTFRELLRRTRETALGAYAHQDMPFEKLVEVL